MLTRNSTIMKEIAIGSIGIDSYSGFGLLSLTYASFNTSPVDSLNALYSIHFMYHPIQHCFLWIQVPVG